MSSTRPERTPGRVGLLPLGLEQAIDAGQSDIPTAPQRPHDRPGPLSRP